MEQVLLVSDQSAVGHDSTGDHRRDGIVSGEEAIHECPGSDSGSVETVVVGEDATDEGAAALDSAGAGSLN